MLKESKIRVLENFYALDYVFFGKSVNEVEMCCPLVKEEYLSVKGALLSVFIEMLKVLDHNPLAIEESVNGAALKGLARESAGMARNNSQKIVTSAKARANIKESLQEELKKDPDANVSQIVEKAIRMKAFGLAVDNLLVARSLNEADQPKGMNTWEGRIVEDSYKILRDSLVESAYQILYDVTDDEPERVAETWDQAIEWDVEEVQHIDEAITQRVKDVIPYYGAINRLFGVCAKKCGRIAITSQQATCKDKCRANRDQAIRVARAKAKAAKARQKGNDAKAAKHDAKAKAIASY